MTDFLPTDLSDLLLWYDAADASTITETAGEVSQWNDKSGNGNDLVQADAGLQPNTSTVNDQESIQFDGGDRLIVSALSAAGDPDNMTIISVITPDDVAGSEDYMGFYSAGGAVRYVVRKTGTTVQWFINGAPGSTTPLLLGAVAGETRWQIWRARTATNGGIDGLDSSGITATNGGTDGAIQDNAQFVIGATPAGGTPYSGHIHEVFVYNRVLTNNERDQVVAYLNFKWLGGFNAVHSVAVPTQSATVRPIRKASAAHAVPVPTQAATVRPIIKTSASHSVPVPIQAASARLINKATAAHSVAVPTQVASARLIAKAAAAQSVAVPTQAAAVRLIVKADAAHSVAIPTQSAQLSAAESRTVTAAHSVPVPTQTAAVGVVGKVSAAHSVGIPTQAAAVKAIVKASAAHSVPVPVQAASIKLTAKVTAAQGVAVPTQDATLALMAPGIVATHSVPVPIQSASIKTIQKVAGAHAVRVPTMTASLCVRSKITAAHSVRVPTQRVSVQVGEKQAIALQGSVPAMGSLHGSLATFSFAGSTSTESLTGSFPT